MLTVSEPPFFEVLTAQVKFKEYCCKPHSPEDLKAAIRENIAAVSQDTLNKVMQNFEEILLKRKRTSSFRFRFGVNKICV
jgi:hypothetical protein